MKHESADLGEKLEQTMAEIDQIRAQYPDDHSIPEGKRIRLENLERYGDRLSLDIRAALDREEGIEAMRQRAIADPSCRIPGSPEGRDPIRTRANPWAGLDESLRAETPTGFRQRAATAVEMLAGLPDESRNRLAEMADSDESGRSAMYVTVASDPDYLSAFRHVLRDPQRGYQMWSDPERLAYQRVESLRATMSLTDANGGYLVPTTLEPGLAALTNVSSTNPFRRICRVETTATDTKDYTVSPGVTAEWLSENTEAADGSPAFSRVSVRPEKLSAWLVGSYEVLADSSFANMLPQLIQDSFDNAEAAAFATGSGTPPTPKGVVTAVTAVTASRVSPQTGGSFSSASITDVYSVFNALTPRARNHPSAAWVANNTTLSTIRRMGESAGAGATLWATLGEGVPPRLLGLPVFESSAMVSAVTTGSNILLAGSFIDYAITDRLGTVVVPVTSVAGQNYRPIGAAGWFCYKRTSGDTLNPDSFRVLRL